MTAADGSALAEAPPLHLRPLPEVLREMSPPPDPEVLALVDEEHARWRALHDRLISLIVTLLDVAADSSSLRDVIARVVGEATVSIDDLVGAGVDPVQIAGLLRAHGSVGDVDRAGDTTTFHHQCGSGGRYWLEHPTVATVAEGEVEGVPGGVPRYCARCIRSIDVHGQGGWTVTPPTRPGEKCTWTLGPASAVGERHPAR